MGLRSLQFTPHRTSVQVLVFMGDAYVALNDHENAARAFRMAFEGILIFLVWLGGSP